MIIVETDSGSALDITSGAAVGSFTATVDTVLEYRVKLTSMNAGAATLTMTVSDGTNTMDSFSTYKGAVAGAYMYGSILANSGETVSLSVESSNASDTSVTWATEWGDMSQVDTASISGDSTAANNVESVFLGTGHTDEVLLSAKQLKLESTDTTVPLVITSNPLYDAVQIEGYNAISLAGENKGVLIDGGVGVTDGISIDTLIFSDAVTYNGAVLYASGIDHLSAINYGAAPTGTDQNATAITATNAIPGTLSDAHGSGSWETASGFFVGSDYFLYDTGYAHSDAVDGSVVRETGDAFSSDYVNQWDVDGDNWAVGE